MGIFMVFVGGLVVLASLLYAPPPPFMLALGIYLALAGIAQQRYEQHKELLNVLRGDEDEPQSEPKPRGPMGVG